MTHSLVRRSVWIACAVVTAIILTATAAVASPRLRAGGDSRDGATVAVSGPSDQARRTFHRTGRRRPRPPVTTTSTVAPSTSTSTTTQPTPTTQLTTATTARPATTTTTAPSTTPSTSPPGGNGAAPTHFNTLAVGVSLPSSAQCAAWVNAVPAPAEVKGVNATANATRGQAVAGATGRATRVDGNFTGTTEQILRWAACKWGIDEDMVKAQAVIESWWRMDTKGDRGTDPTRCAPGHGIGVDGFPGECPESWGLLQVRYPYNQVAFPWAITSSAFNADWAYAQWRACFEGDLTWLNTVERGSDYAAGDAWGCFGTWFSGRWYTQGAKDYIARVQGTLAERTWTTPNFKQP